MDPLNDKGVFSYLNLLFDVIPDPRHSINLKLYLTLLGVHVGGPASPGGPPTKETALIAWLLYDFRAGIQSSISLK